MVDYSERRQENRNKRKNKQKRWNQYKIKQQDDRLKPKNFKNFIKYKSTKYST